MVFLVLYLVVVVVRVAIFLFLDFFVRFSIYFRGGVRFLGLGGSMIFDFVDGEIEVRGGVGFCLKSWVGSCG